MFTCLILDRQEVNNFYETVRMTTTCVVSLYSKQSYWRVSFILYIWYKFKQESSRVPSSHTWSTQLISLSVFPGEAKEFLLDFFFFFLLGYVPTLETTRVKSEINKCLKMWSADHIFTPKDAVTYLIQLKEFALWHLSQSNSFYFFEQKWQETYWRNPIKKKLTITSLSLSIPTLCLW